MDLPAGMGANLAAPYRPVVVLIGDGGLQFSVAELASAVEARVPLIVLLWNNDGYGEIKTYMMERQIAPIGVDIFTPDFLTIARGFGCSANRPGSFEDSSRELREAKTRNGPTLIEIRADASICANNRVPVYGCAFSQVSSSVRKSATDMPGRKPSLQKVFQRIFRARICISQGANQFTEAGDTSVGEAAVTPRARKARTSAQVCRSDGSKTWFTSTLPERGRRCWRFEDWQVFRFSVRPACPGAR